MHKTFPVVHKQFYELFTPWFKQMKKENQPETGVYKLYVTKPISRFLKADDK
jgi:hypothetical protein